MAWRRFSGLMAGYVCSFLLDDDHRSCGPQYMSILLRGLEHLRMRRREYDMLVDNFISSSAKDGNRDMDIPSTVRNAIFGSTLGHPGIIRQILTLFHYQCQQGLHGAPAMLQYLVSPSFQDVMQGSSSFSWIATRRFSKDEARFLHDALNRTDLQATFHVNRFDPIAGSISCDFKHTGIVTGCENVMDRLQFAAPLWRTYSIDSITAKDASHEPAAAAAV
ncbi:hypothetical protein AMATHDRAFT_5216 [Amanita thiersii Skay4041]|uniref:Uncharacterized protein n=1 Tax=Amanita thiersii Skay4041 TaxID=703135 RepID=A0A2A9NL77_9AGAR|nr:hypothetical protein AMATHDRAFT_5216 [Amanita thiersii Skay4041]